jgi:hypothetical protein
MTRRLPGMPRRTQNIHVGHVANDIVPASAGHVSRDATREERALPMRFGPDWEEGERPSLFRGTARMWQGHGSFEITREGVADCFRVSHRHRPGASASDRGGSPLSIAHRHGRRFGPRRRHGKSCRNPGAFESPQTVEYASPAQCRPEARRPLSIQRTAVLVPYGCHMQDRHPQSSVRLWSEHAPSQDISRPWHVAF